MKKFIVLLFAVATTAGCASVQYKTPEGAEVKVQRIFNNSSFGELSATVSKEGTKEIKIKGYKSSVSAEAIEAAVGAAVRAAGAAAPVPGN